MINLDFIKHFLGLGPNSIPENITFSGVKADSRLVETGDLFVALPGEHFDGHEFIAKAIDRGATGVIHHKDRKVNIPNGIHSFEVKESVESLRILAGAWRQELSCPVVAICGSVGKTTTKQMAAAILSSCFPNLASTKASQNGYLGIALTLLNTPLDAGMLVVEIGIDKIGAMLEHMRLVAPDIGLITRIDYEHLSGLGSIGSVAKEELACFDWLLHNHGKMVVNLSDFWQRAWVNDCRPSDMISYELVSEGIKSSSTIRGVLQGDVLLISDLMGNKGEFSLPLPGSHNASNLLGAVSVAHSFDMSLEQISEGLSAFVPPPDRSQIREGIKGVSFLCDYYNASPASMDAALRTVSDLAEKAGGRPIACLGDMLELGSAEETLHRDVAVTLSELGFEGVFCIGDRTKWIINELENLGFSGAYNYCSDLESMTLLLHSFISKGDAVLIKGSRQMTMEKVWENLTLTDLGR